MGVEAGRWLATWRGTSAARQSHARRYFGGQSKRRRIQRQLGRNGAPRWSSRRLVRETLVGHGAMDSELWRGTEANGGRPSVGVDFKPRGLEQRGEVGQAIVPSDGRNAIEVEHHRPEALDWRVHVVGSGNRDAGSRRRRL